jgi:competence protein ComEC
MGHIRRTLIGMLAALLLLGGCASARVETDGDDLNVEIIALNVGKADAILVRLGENDYLIDTGLKKQFDTLKDALDTLGVTHLAGLFLTHTDKDHGGGMVKLAESGIQIDAIYASELYAEKDYDKHQAVKAAAALDMEVTWLTAGDALDAGNGCTFEVLGPLSIDAEDENNNSLVLRLTTPEGTALFMGDAELEEEAAVIAASADKLDADYMKVAHHGRDDATSLSLARMVSPQIAVISTDRTDEPRSADANVIASLESAGAAVYVTEDFELGVRVRLRDGQAELIAE